jgi:hypothetical protein
MKNEDDTHVLILKNIVMDKNQCLVCKIAAALNRNINNTELLWDYIFSFFYVEDDVKTDFYADILPVASSREIMT